MKLFDFFNLFKKKKKKEDIVKKSVTIEKHINPDAKPILIRNTGIDEPIELNSQNEINIRNTVIADPIELNSQNEINIRNNYIAFDVETTGFNRATDRIVEIGAVLFQNGEVKKTFSSLVNPGISIPKAASDVNHITNEMLADAPTEREVYPLVIDFLGDALRGEIIMCAHNAQFDIHFLGHALYRLGYDAKIKYLDTLSLSKKYIKGLENYKLQTLEKYYGIENEVSHRACSDAASCGHILWNLIDAAQESLETERRCIENAKPNDDELEVCAYIQDTISRNGGNAKHIRFQKNRNGYVTVYCYYDLLRRFLRFKLSKKGNYIIVKANYVSDGHHTEKCSQSEGDETFLRFCFKSPFDLEAVCKYIYKEYSDCLYDLEQFTSYRECETKDVEYSLRFMTALTDDDVAALLNSAAEHDREREENEKQKEEEEKRIVEEKAKIEAERKAKKEAALSAPKKPKGKAVLQMDDDGNVIKEFVSINDAVREIGISKSCIRDAANGNQKHAGGYCWKFKDN